MQPPGTEPRYPTFRRQALLTFVLATLLGAFFQVNPGFLDTPEGSQWFSQRSPGVNPGDSGYHIRMAWLYRTGEIQQAGPDFHWTRLSVWNGRFADKDFLYHVYLVPFTVFAQDAYDHDGLVKGAKIGAAFGWGILALALLTALRLLGVRRAWPFVLLAAATSWIFMLRLGEARSWAFSASCAVLGWACIVRGKRAGVFCVGVVYTLSYTASHILLILAIFHLCARIVLGPDAGSRGRDLLRNASVVGMAVLGIGVGLLLHPLPWELLRLWWVQNVLVLFLHGGGEVGGLVGSITQSVMGWEKLPRNLALPPIMFGQELQPLPTKLLLQGFGVALVLPVLVGLAALVARWRPPRNAIMTGAIATGLVVLVPRSLRFSEYAIPFLALAAGLWLPGLAASARVQALLGQGRRRVLLQRLPNALVALVLAAQCAALHVANPYVPITPQPAMVAWLETNHEVRGKFIYNASWDSFPDLFLVRTDCDYAAGLDPAFVAAAGTRQSQIFINLALGRIDYVASDGPGLARIFRKEIGADYVFVSNRTQPVLYDGCKQMARHNLLELAFEDEFAQTALYRVPR